MMTLGERICAAIRTHSIIQFHYESERRQVEPHCLGYDIDRNLLLRGWQIAGTAPGWRDFHVFRLSGLSTTGATFVPPRANDGPELAEIRRILCSV